MKQEKPERVSADYQKIIAQMGDLEIEELENLAGLPDAPAPQYQNPNSYPPLGPLPHGNLKVDFDDRDQDKGKPIKSNWEVNEKP